MKGTSFTKSSPPVLIGIVIFAGIALGIGGWFYFRFAFSAGRTARVMTWLRQPGAHPDWAAKGGSRCSGAPFLLPSSGFIGFIWGDSFRIGHKHQGIDIFSGAPAGVTPVIAAYTGYLSRLPAWKSSLIIRIPEDPLQPGRQIWAYYTHMAYADGRSLIVNEFPAGTSERFVKSGTLLGYQGDFSGDPGNPVGVHLHFSIVKNDPASGEGEIATFKNELVFENTLDPSPYLGLPLNAENNPDGIPLCRE